MARNPLLALSLKSTADGAAVDPFADPAYLDAIVVRRIAAFVIDQLIAWALVVVASAVLFLLNILMLGALTPGLVSFWVLVHLLYYIGFIGGQASATPGMMMLNLVVRTYDGRIPGFSHAVLRTLLFYATTTLLTPLILVVVLFTDKRLALHDFLSGTRIIVSRIPAAD